MIIAEVAIFPTSEGSSVSKYVRKGIDAIKKTGLKCETGAMATVIEATSLDEIFDAVKRAHTEITSMNVNRIHIDIRIDHRYDKEISIESKKKAIK